MLSSDARRAHIVGKAAWSATQQTVATLPVDEARRNLCYNGMALIACFSTARLAAAAPGDMLRVQGFDPSAVPRLGRFEPLAGAKAFIGPWRLACEDGPSGLLNFLRNGDVELRSIESSAIVGLGTQPWTYVSPKAPDTIVRLSWDIDCGEAGILRYQGTLDSAGGPTRQLLGSFETVVKRPYPLDPQKKTGTFAATFAGDSDTT